MVTIKKANSTLTPTDNKKRKAVTIKVPKTENIIFIGSEMYYNSFWLKMMFIATAYVKEKTLRKADKKTIAYVDEGYTYAEKLTLDYFREKKGFEIVKLASSEDVVKLMNKDRDKFKLQDVAFFSHGVIDQISLNYRGDEDVDFDVNNFAAVKKTAFAANGRLYSYACRTGVSVDKDSFKTQADAHPENSIAQKMATHFGIEVHAFLMRTYYGGVIRDDATQSANIKAVLNERRKTSDGEIIEIPPEHQALPHDGLADKGMKTLLYSYGAIGEGTNEYALWRKNGGRKLPAAADTPKGLTTQMLTFKPKL